MRKEVLFAIIAGISIGLIIAFGAWRVSKLINKKPNTQTTQKTPPPNQNLSLSVSNLDDYYIITENPYTIKGLSTPKDPIIVSTIEEDYFTTTNEDGTFEIEVEFPAGLSEVKINEKKILVVFSTEFGKYLTTTSDNATPEQEEEKTATDESNTKSNLEVIRERVMEEISSKSLKKLAYVGTITDINSGSIQIKSLEGDIKQLSLSDDASFVNTLKNNIEVKQNDLAIGDFIVAMGIVNGNKVLDTKRILISKMYPENTYTTEEIEISTLTRTKINDLTLPKSWKGPNVSELEVGQKIIIVGKREENKNYTLRSIFTPVE